MAPWRRDMGRGAGRSDLGMDRDVTRRGFPRRRGGWRPARSSARGSLRARPWRAGRRQLLSAHAERHCAAAIPARSRPRMNLRDGDFWTGDRRCTTPARPRPGRGRRRHQRLGGGAISTAQARPSAQILILDNHDDFGGHAKRNEFHLGGHTLHLLNGGTLEIDSPYPYCTVADGLMKTLGIDPAGAGKSLRQAGGLSRPGLARVFFDKETFGADRLVAGAPSRMARQRQSWTDVPRQDAAQRRRPRRHPADRDRHATISCPAFPRTQKKDRLSRICYRDYLTNIVKADPAAHRLLPAAHRRSVGLRHRRGLGAGLLGRRPAGLPGPEARARRSAAAHGLHAGRLCRNRRLLHLPFPGRQRLHRAAAGARPDPRRLAGHDARGHRHRARPTTAGSTSPARRCASASTRSWCAPATPASRRRNRLHEADGGEPGVSRVRAKDCVLASWNMMIPYLCPELPAAQKAALHKLIKTPLVYTSVALRNWQRVPEARHQPESARRAAITPRSRSTSRSISAATKPRAIAGRTRSWCTWCARPASPACRSASSTRPAAPNCCRPRSRPSSATSATSSAARLAAGGFDPARDIAGITVNRWPHGYAPNTIPCSSRSAAPTQHAQRRRPRQRFGRIAIANSDSGMAAYTDIAIDQAHRAVGEILELRIRGGARSRPRRSAARTPAPRG